MIDCKEREELESGFCIEMPEICGSIGDSQASIDTPDTNR